ncbi:MAG: hypothetical protein KDD40_10080, partial [Bdellovibrionales bacterium]|nr:hypothetical protein [Bdellovibrionales bacterium]
WKSLSLVFLLQTALASTGIREVSQTSCVVIPIHLGLGMTTQLIFEQEPKVTLYADKKHFIINTNKFSPRSLAIIPLIDASELESLRSSSGKMPDSDLLAKILDKNYKTNLFIFFQNNNQFMFELRFVEKKQADYIVKITQKFSKDCLL